MPERTVKTALELRHIRSSSSTNLPSIYLDPFLRCFATRMYVAVVDKAKLIYVYENRDIKYESERNSCCLLFVHILQTSPPLLGWRRWGRLLRSWQQRASARSLATAKSYRSAYSVAANIPALEHRERKNIDENELSGHKKEDFFRYNAC